MQRNYNITVILKLIFGFWPRNLLLSVEIAVTFKLYPAEITAYHENNAN